MFNLAAIHEAIAEVIPERECLVFRDRRFSWALTTDRTRRLAALLRDAGLGCRREREELRNWESGQDHLALYLHNGNEYLEGMLGAYKARCAPFNVNYRYVQEELLHLFEDAQALAGSSSEPPRGLSPDDLYLLYTGGTTGKPKGVLWRQEDIFKAALSSGRGLDSISNMQARAQTAPGPRSLPSPPFMHGAAHWVAFNMWHVGGTVVVQSQVDRLDPDDIWSTAEREKVNSLTIVGDAFGRPLLDQLREKTQRTFPVVGGRRYAIPGDLARVNADGSLQLLGRDSVTINSGGEKIFAEEVEHALKHHPAVYDAVVVGTPSQRWGSQVTAVVQLRPGCRPDDEDLRQGVREHLAGFKLPKVFVYVERIVRSPSGKADYRWAERTASEVLGLVE